MEFKGIKYGVKFVACCGVAWFCYACSTQATVSGLEISDNVMTNAYDQVRYDGCFWKNDLWIQMILFSRRCMNFCIVPLRKII